jgi:hypothetical protein
MTARAFTSARRQEQDRAHLGRAFRDDDKQMTWLLSLPTAAGRRDDADARRDEARRLCRRCGRDRCLRRNRPQHHHWAREQLRFIATEIATEHDGTARDANEPRTPRPTKLHDDLGR